MSISITKYGAYFNKPCLFFLICIALQFAHALPAYAQLPTLSSISPSSATAGGPAFTLTVTGLNLTALSTVRWNGSDRPTSFVGVTQLTAEISASDIAVAGTANVTVFVPVVGTLSSFTFTINQPAPTITNLNPSSAVASGPGFTLTVNGSSFVSGSVVRWNGSARPTTYVSSTQLTAAISAADIAAAGSASVTVVSSSGLITSNTATFIISPAQTIASLNPSSATAADAAFTLTVNGTNFVSGMTVKWNQANRTTTFVSSTQLTADISTADIAAAGSASVTVVSSSGLVRSNTATFTVSPAQTITSLSPNSAKAGEAAFTLTVNGTNFISGMTVKWNGASRTTTFVGATQLKASIPAADIASAGLAGVTVVSRGGLVTSNTATLSVNNPVPTLSSLSPASDTAGDPAFTLTVNGTNFVSGVSVVRWNGADRPVTFVSSTQLRASITAADIAAAGTASVTVFNSTPGGGTSNTKTFTINSNNPAPSLSSISPKSVTAGGAAFTLSVTGLNFVAGSKVRWNGADRATSYVSDTQLTAAITASDIAAGGTASITVFSPAPGGGTSSTKTFTINNSNLVPTLSAITPTSVTAGDPAFTLTVNGLNFVPGSVVRWNGSDRFTTYLSDSRLTASIPASDVAVEGTASVRVFNPAPGGGTSGPQTFTIAGVNPTPSTSGLSPSSVTAGSPGFTLTVTGSNFAPDSVVRWNGVDLTTTFVNDTQLTASIPASDLTAAGTVDLTVFNPAPGGGTSEVRTFTINGSNLIPELSSISPKEATAGGPGLTLTLRGSNFVFDSTVRWNGVDRSTTFISDTQLTTAIPASDIAVAGTANVTVFNPTPGGGTSTSKTFTISSVNPVPTTSGTSPASTLAGGSAFTLTVNGSDFVSESLVRWNGADRSTSFVSDAEITAEIPASDIATAGTASVTVFSPAPGGGTSNAQAFTIAVNPVPAITSLGTTFAEAGSGAFTLRVNGNNFIDGSVVRWNGADRTTTYVSGAQLTAAITAADIAAAGTASVTVFNPAPGGGTSNAQTFTIVPPNPVPAISNLSPTSITAGNPGFVLTVNGSSFVSGSVVRWNGSARPTTYVSSTQLTAAISAADIAAAGSASVRVFNEGPGGGLSNVRIVTIRDDTPVLSNLSPSSVTAGSEAIILTVNGSNFSPGSIVLWNGFARSTTFVSSTQLTATIGSTDLRVAGTAQVAVSNDGTLSNTLAFTVVNVSGPVISGILPNSGPTVGNTKVTIRGQNFEPGMTVLIDGVPVSGLTLISDREVTGFTSPHAPGTFDTEVIQTGGKALLADGYTYKILATAASRLASQTALSQWIPFVVDSSGFRTNLGVNNLSSEAADVTLFLIENNGLVVAQRQISVPPHGMTQINNVGRVLEETETRTGREGYVILESRQEIRAWASQINNASSDPSMELARSSAASRVLLPSSVSNERFSTSLMIINSSSRDGQVNILARSQGGEIVTALASRPIPANGYLFYEDFYRSSHSGNTYGPIEIEALGSIQILATERISTRNNTGGYFEGIDTTEAGRNVVLPYSVDTLDFRTNLGINNLGSSPASVLVSLTDESGMSLGSLTATVPPNGLTQLNNINQLLLEYGGVTNREGTLRLSADQKIVAWTSQIDNVTQDPSLVAGRPASQKLLIPSITRVGSFKSTLVVANIEDSANIVELRFRNTEGSILASKTILIPAKGFFTSDDILEELGVDEIFGPLEIVSHDNKRLLAISRVYNTRRTGGYFAGLP